MPARASTTSLWIWLLAVALLGDLLLAGWLLHVLHYGSGVDEDSVKKQWLVDVRRAHFNESTGNRSLLDADPTALRAHGFAWDPPDVVAAWARATLPELPYARGLDLDALPRPEMARAQAVALLYSKNGGRGCGHFANLESTLLGIVDGEGCCSDHSRAFLALGEAAGLAVREVGHATHTFDEVYLHDTQRWAFIDTMYAIVAADGAGGFLSTLEIRERLQRGGPVDWRFFGTAAHEFSHGDPRQHVYYATAEPFSDLVYTWGADVIQQDRFRARLASLPESAQDVVGLTLGSLPVRVQYADAAARLPAAQRHARWLHDAVVFGLALGTIVPSVFLWRRTRSAGLRGSPRRPRDPRTSASTSRG